MIPTKSDWNGWSVLERATYVAQFAAALALLPTVIFAWLGWREARTARTEQMQFFIAEKAPDIEVTSIKFLPVQTSDSGLITFYLKNVGGSPATKLQIAIFKIGSRTAIRDTASDTDFFHGRLTIDKGKEFPLPLLGVEEVASHIGWEPSALRVFRLGDTLAPSEEVVLLLSVQFEGLFGDQHGILESIAATRKTPNPSIAPAAAAHVKR